MYSMSLAKSIFLYFRKTIFYCTLLFLITFSNYLEAQKKLEIYQLQVTAKEYFDNYKYHLALPVYLTLYQLNPEVSEYKYAIAYCYLFLDKNEKALPFFQLCLQEPEKYPLQMMYYAAKAYHLSGKYDFALKYFEIYKNYLSQNKKNIKNGMVASAERDIRICSTAKELSAKPNGIKITNMGGTINTEYPEYGPVVSADQSILIFTSNRPNTTGGNIDPIDGKYFEDIYICYHTDTGWSIPEKMGTNINTFGHDASIGLSADGQKLILYRYSEATATFKASGDLYISELNGNTWMPAVKMSENINSSGWEPSASLSSDEKTLFFTSDRKDGKGGTDIYSIKKLPHGEWAMPQNLGDIINTPYDEDSPYLHPDGKTLYFSSNGHNTMGGYDIFKSKWDEDLKTWSIPINIGPPINTPHDDIHFSWSADGRRVFFSSIRSEGFGDRDLYYADLNTDAAEVMLLKGRVLDSTSKQPISAKIYISDKPSNDIIESASSNSETGKYLLLFSEGKGYRIEIQAKGYETIIQDVNIEELHEFKEIHQDFFMQKLDEN
ncbi:MAG: hypothetical protein EAZ07_06475 [Cytophagales bacterium]|nr:MAG: hypothetical protein EAZ07_06475 [Cytophagales bacterium]